MKLKGKVACITGAARGLGYAMAEELAKEGAIPVLVDIDEPSVERAVNRLHDQGYEACGFAFSVSNRHSVMTHMERMVKRFGGLDILVNNAGGSLGTPKTLEDITEADWDLVVDVNLKGTFLCSQSAIPYMKEKGGGKIINLASIGGRTASIVTGVAYAAAKGGIISFTRRLAKEVGHWNIQVNAIAPGLVLSGERMQRIWEGMSEQEQALVLQSIPLMRLSSLEEQAKVVSFLASEDSNYVTGAVIDVNGGRFMG